MVGSKQDGTDMTDKDHEGTSAAVLTEIKTYLGRSLGYKPNVVIINGGTNNANGNRDVNLAYQQMEDIVNDIWNYNDMSNTCVMLSTLLPTDSAQGRVNRISINQAYRNLVRDKSGAGKCIYLADMEPSGPGADFLSLNGNYWADFNPKIHPNNEGHKRMAYVFYAAIHRALNAGRIQEAAPKESEAQTGCEKRAGNGEYAGKFFCITQRGSGEHDGTYKHKSREIGVLFEIESPWDRNQWRFARLFNRRYDDLVGWYDFGPNDHRFGIWKNSADGRGSFRRLPTDLFGNIYCIPRGLHFIDMNADGLDDIVCISPDGQLHLSVNEGNGSGDRPPTFKYIGHIKNSEGTQSRVRLADIDGDGRGDYGVIGDDGSIRFWRNGGNGDKPEFWQPLGIRSTMKPILPGTSQFEGFRFEDINGDGRDDWMWMRTDGYTTTWTNARSCTRGREGDGLNVAWRQAHYGDNTEGPTHYGVAYLRGDEDFEDWRQRIHFARIYGTQESFGNLGVQDYVFMQVEKLGTDKYKFKVRVWKNEGGGGTKLLADGNKYCNMYGHADGREDYVWALSTGHMRLWRNLGKKVLKAGEYYWDSPVTMWNPSAQFDRRDIHLTDWDGDGDCDIVWVNPENGNVRIWLNDYPTLKNWAHPNVWRPVGSPPTLTCEHRRGIGIHDLAVRFADITGNKRSDYLCIAPNGRVKGATQNDNGSWRNHAQIKFADGQDRANLRWADVNGDGSDDMIWVDKFNGNGRVWYNEGAGNPAELSGSSFKWRKINNHVYDGSVAGTCQYFPDFDGNGRADLHSIKGTWTNQGETWLNPSCGLRDATGDDPGGIVNPQLPEQPGNPIGGEGPGNGGGECRGRDNRDWRSVTCTNRYIESHVDFTSRERWLGIDVPGAWASVIEYWQCRLANNQPRSQFSNVVSDFFNGPQGMHCDQWMDSGNGCRNLGLVCGSTQAGPAGYFILHSFSKIYDLQYNFYTAIESAVNFADAEAIASDFGLLNEPGMNPSLSIIIDIAVMGYGLIMGPVWNKWLVPLNPGPNAGTVKDEVNDLVKNGATLAKDVYAHNNKAADPLGTQTKIRTHMKDLAKAWRSSIADLNKKLWDGSDDSILKLNTLMQDGSMLERALLEQNDQEALQASFEKVLSAFLIPQSWAVSPSLLYPVIIRFEACH
ncbi:hypothetical protein ACHAQA_003924 [Verticillium albo-atrum]